jgi:hypothetical protein
LLDLPTGGALRARAHRRQPAPRSLRRLLATRFDALGYPRVRNYIGSREWGNGDDFRIVIPEA